MSLRQPDIPSLYDPRLDDASNGLLNKAEQIRQALQFPPQLINTKIMFLSAREDEMLKLMLDPYRQLFSAIERQANSPDWYFGDYQNPYWNDGTPWDQHVDSSIEKAFRQAHKHDIVTASPDLLIEQLLISDPITDIVASKMALESLGSNRVKPAQTPVRSINRPRGPNRIFRIL